MHEIVSSFGRELLQFNCIISCNILSTSKLLHFLPFPPFSFLHFPGCAGQNNKDGGGSAFICHCQHIFEWISSDSPRLRKITFFLEVDAINQVVAKTPEIVCRSVADLIAKVSKPFQTRKDEADQPFYAMQ